MVQAPPVFEDDPELIDKALAAVRKTYNTGKTKPLSFRLQQLKNIKNGLTVMEKELSIALTNDLGKSDFTNWMFEFATLHREIDDIVGNLKKWMADECVDTHLALGPGKSYLMKEPLGVILVLGSWNFPLSTTLLPAITAIAAGNAVVIKPSEMSAYSAKAMKTLCARYLDLSAYKCVNGQV